MNEMQLRVAPRLTAAIAAVKDGIAEAYGGFASGLSGAAARARWQEAHGACASSRTPRSLG